MVASQLRGRMDDSAQQRLFAETPGSIDPPEKDLYLGTSGWSYADWEGTLYPEALPSASRLAEYVKRFATVEIDSTFYGTPRLSTAQNWRGSARWVPVRRQVSEGVLLTNSKTVLIAWGVGR